MEQRQGKIQTKQRKTKAMHKEAKHLQDTQTQQAVLVS